MSAGVGAVSTAVRNAAGCALLLALPLISSIGQMTFSRSHIARAIQMCDRGTWRKEEASFVIAAMLYVGSLGF
ncbi:MAG: hypothetical protein Q8M31_01600 [Beijerinckiaceae bacterium]|nr:hypothetical protein [Beijerinckiaceae bacterium]